MSAFLNEVIAPFDRKVRGSLYPVTWRRNHEIEPFVDQRFWCESNRDTCWSLVTEFIPWLFITLIYFPSSLLNF